MGSTGTTVDTTKTTRSPSGTPNLNQTGPDVNPNFVQDARQNNATATTQVSNQKVKTIDIIEIVRNAAHEKGNEHLSEAQVEARIKSIIDELKASGKDLSLVQKTIANVGEESYIDSLRGSYDSEYERIFGQGSRDTRNGWQRFLDDNSFGQFLSGVGENFSKLGNLSVKAYGIAKKWVEDGGLVKLKDSVVQGILHGWEWMKEKGGEAFHAFAVLYEHYKKNPNELFKDLLNGQLIQKVFIATVHVVSKIQEIGFQLLALASEEIGLTPFLRAAGAALNSARFKMMGKEKEAAEEWARAIKEATKAKDNFLGAVGITDLIEASRLISEAIASDDPNKLMAAVGKLLMGGFKLVITVTAVGKVAQVARTAIFRVAALEGAEMQTARVSEIAFSKLPALTEERLEKAGLKIVEGAAPKVEKEACTVMEKAVKDQTGRTIKAAELKAQPEEIRKIAQDALNSPEGIESVGKVTESAFEDSAGKVTEDLLQEASKKAGFKDPAEAFKAAIEDWSKEMRDKPIKKIAEELKTQSMRDISEETAKKIADLAVDPKALKEMLESKNFLAELEKICGHGEVDHLTSTQVRRVLSGKDLEELLKLKDRNAIAKVLREKLKAGITDGEATKMAKGLRLLATEKDAAGYSGLTKSAYEEIYRKMENGITDNFTKMLFDKGMTKGIRQGMEKFFTDFEEKYGIKLSKEFREEIEMRAERGAYKGAREVVRRHVHEAIERYLKEREIRNKKFNSQEEEEAPADEARLKEAEEYKQYNNKPTGIDFGKTKAHVEEGPKLHKKEEFAKTEEYKVEGKKVTKHEDDGKSFYALKDPVKTEPHPVVPNTSEPVKLEIVDGGLSKDELLKAARDIQKSKGKAA